MRNIASQCIRNLSYRKKRQNQIGLQLSLLQSRLQIAFQQVARDIARSDRNTSFQREPHKSGWTTQRLLKLSKVKSRYN